MFKGDRLELVVHIAAYYGLRKCEIIGLKWDAIDFEHKTLTVHRKVVCAYDLISDAKMKVIFVDSWDITNHTTIQSSVYAEYTDISDDELIKLDKAEIYKIKDVKYMVLIEVL